MGKDRLEEYIKDQIHGHRSEVNPDAIWAAIQQPEQKKRRPFWLLGLIGILLVSALVGYQFMGDESDNLTEQKISNSQNLANKTSKEINVISQENQNLNSNVSSPETSIKEIEISTPIEKQIESVDLASEIESDTKSNTAVTRTAQRKLTVNSVPANNKLTSNVNSSKPIAPLAKAEAKPISEPIATTIPSPVMAFSTKPVQAIQDRDIKGLGQSKPQAKLLPLSITLLDPQDFQVRFKRAITPEFLSTPKQETLIEPIEIKSGTWFIAGHYGYLKGSRILSGDTLDFQELTIRNSYEEFMEAWELGGLIGYTHRSGWSLETGLTYTQINDRSIVPRVEEKFLFPKPDFYGRIIIKERTIINQHRYHKIRMIDVPVHLSYEKAWGKWSLRPGAGINLNLITSGGGNIAGINDGEVSLMDVSKLTTFKNNIGYNLEAKLKVEYQLSNTFRINLSTSYKHYPNSFTIGGIEQRYKMWGLKLGMQKSF